MESKLQKLHEKLFEILREIKDAEDELPDDAKWIILSYVSKAIREINIVILKHMNT